MIERIIIVLLIVWLSILQTRIWNLERFMSKTDKSISFLAKVSRFLLEKGERHE